MNIIFFGTDEFATIVLQRLMESNANICAVVAPPDEPAGRKQIPQSSPVKLFAQSHELTILQPKKFDTETLNALNGYGADVGVLTVYGKLLPNSLLTLFPKGVVNIHPSLLPRYRGPSPIKTALLNGDKETGVTIILLDEKMDHGPMLAQSKTNIDPDEKLPELRDRLAHIGAELLIDTLKDYLENTAPLIQQDDASATFTRFFTKDDGKIDLNKPSAEINNQFRAFYDWPGIWTIWQGKRLKLLNVAISELHPTNIKNGELFIDSEKLYIQCGSDSLQILELQPEGKSPLTAQQFINGYRKHIQS